MSNDVRIRALLDDKASSGLDRLKGKLDTVGGKGTASTAFGVAAAKGFDLIGGSALKAGEAIGEFIGDSIDAASDLQQSTGGVESVFGELSGKVEAFGKTAAESIGLSKNAVNELATVLGSQLQGMGFDLDEAANKTLLLEQRGADLAATFGGTTKDAVEAISSLLRGERDPIEKYGVSIKDVDVKARILADGLDTSTAAAEKHATATASLELLLESTAKAEGRFADEAGTAAGAAQRQAAKMENLRAKLGDKLLPIQEAVTEGQIVLVDTLSDLADGLEDLGRPIGDFVGWLGDARRAGEDLGDSVPFVAGAFDLIGKAATGLIQPLFFAKDRIDGFVNSTGEPMSRAAVKFAESTEGMAEDARESGRILRQSASDAADQVPPDADKISGSIAGIGSAAIRAGHQVDLALSGVIDSIKGSRGDVQTEADDVASAIFDAVILKGGAAGEKADLARDKFLDLAELASLGDTQAAQALRAQLKQLESTKHLTLEQKVEIRELRAALKRLEQSYDDAAEAADRLANAKLEHALVRFGQAPSPRAAGGPVKADNAYLIGETGPELFIPDESGVIMPNPGGGGLRLPTAGASGWGGGGTTINVNFNSTWPPTPAQTREITAVISEELHAEFDRSSGTSVRQ
jgi:hypothetical protein